VGVDWRMDYCIKNNSLGNIGKPVYFVSLETEKNVKLKEGVEGGVESESGSSSSQGSTERVEFTCNLEELQDLVSKLKDAAKQMERVQEELKEQ
tara:strand:- start:336 stop:617 length:282 start_codon:yes stop_codon:yes gene_type:complete